MVSEEQSLRVTSLGQYIKGINFETHKNKFEFSKIKEAPMINYQLAVHQGVQDTNIFEVELQIELTAKIKEEQLFNFEIGYAGLFKVEGEVSDSIRDEVLSVNCVTLLFPFARREVSEILVGAGLPPILLDPVDFRAVYVQSKKQEEDKGLQDLSKFAMGAV